jgi:hypothetical protein
LFLYEERLLPLEEYYFSKEAGEFSLEAEMYQRKELVARAEGRRFPYDAPQKPLEERHLILQRVWQEERNRGSREDCYRDESESVVKPRRTA